MGDAYHNMCLDCRNLYDPRQQWVSFFVGICRPPTNPICSYRASLLVRRQLTLNLARLSKQTLQKRGLKMANDSAGLLRKCSDI